LRPAPGARWGWLAVLLAAGTACQPEPPVPRYLYVVTCDARVDKLDTSAARKEASYDLAASALSAILPAGNQSIDGCLAYHPVFDTGGALLYFVSPTQTQANPDGTRDYRVLGFSVPSMKLVKNLPAGAHQSEAPHLELAPDRSLRVVPAKEWRAATEIDLTAYGPTHEALPNQIIESSGDRTLLRTFAATPEELRLAVADTKAKTLVWLKSPPPTTALLAHLAPGGDVVMIEVTEAGKATEKTGTLALFDSNTGASLEERAAGRARSQYFLAISPDGKGVYHSGEDYSFIDLKRTFSSQSVAHPLDPNRPAAFFAKF
jgi:hypothetical protein